MAKRRNDWRDLGGSVFGHGPGETFRGTRGDDNLVGTDSDDTFRIRQSGVDHVHAGKGRDIIYAGPSLTAEDRINGGKLRHPCSGWRLFQRLDAANRDDLSNRGD